MWLFAFSAATLIFALLLLRHHFYIISAAIPLDLYEGTMPLITGIIADGDNPYTRAFQPQAADVYPPLYNMVVAPLTGPFGNTLILHRIVSAFFIGIACLLCIVPSYKLTGSAIYAVAVGTTTYAGLIFYSTPVASTNAMGVALFLASVVVPWLAGFTTRSLAFAVCCAVLSFYTKQYFILGMAMLCLYVFLYISAIRALVTGAIFALAMVACLTIVHKTSPYFIDNTLISPVVSLDGLKMWSMVTMQSQIFLQIYGGLIAVLVGALCLALWKMGSPAITVPLQKLITRNTLSLNRPLMTHKVDYFGFCFFWSSAAFIVYLGRNPGNYMTYVFQLVSPFFLIWSFTHISRLKNIAWVAPLVFITYYQAFTFLPRDFSYDEANWERMNTLIAPEKDILATQMLLMSLLENNKTIYQDGHTSYFPLASQKPEWLKKENPNDAIEVVWDQYMTEIYRKVRTKEFDLIIISPWEMRGIFLRNPPPRSKLDGRQLLKRHYYVDETIPLSMTDRQGGGTYKLQVWRPKKSNQRDTLHDKQ